MCEERESVREETYMKGGKRVKEKEDREVCVDRKEKKLLHIYTQREREEPEEKREKKGRDQ